MRVLLHKVHVMRGHRSGEKCSTLLSRESDYKTKDTG